MKSIKKNDLLFVLYLQQPEDLQGEIMTIAQQLKQEGRQEGRYEIQREMALRLIEANIAADEKIAELVGLPYEEIKRLIDLHRQKTVH